METYEESLFNSKVNPFGKKVVEKKYYFQPEIWPKSTSVLYPIWVTKDVLINVIYNTSLKLKKHLGKPGIISFKTFRSKFFAYLLGKPMSASEHEYIYIQRKKADLISKDNSFPYSRES